MPPSEVPETALRRQRIAAGLRNGGFTQAYTDVALWEDMQAEARSGDPDRLVNQDMLRVVESARASRQEGQMPLGLFFSTDDVIILPGILGSELIDVRGRDGVIWIDPKLVAGAVLGTAKLNHLKLAPYKRGAPDADAVDGLSIQPNGAIPVIYGALKYDLEVRRYSVQIFGYDWRKHLDQSAAILAGIIRDRATRRFRPLHIIGHSLGTVVARRALQLVGADLGRKLVNNLVLIGPATAGSLSAAFALAGNNSLVESVRRFGIKTPDGFNATMQSMTGLYQLLPWRTEPVDRAATIDPAIAWLKANLDKLKAADFWKAGIEKDRLDDFLGWSRTVDAGFLNDRTTLILGDRPTVGGVMYNKDGALVEDPAFTTSGDGTVPDSMARVEGVTRIFRAKGAEHMMLPATLSVLAAVRDVLAGRPPQVDRVLGMAAADGVPTLATPENPLPRPRAVPVDVGQVMPEPPQPPAPAKGLEGPPPKVPPGPSIRPIAAAWESKLVPPPTHRNLRVFSFDPLFATELEALGTEQITLALPWEFADGDGLEPGPVGEYVEVVDYDPASGCFYPPADLNHPHVLAEDGLPASEGDPKFHQQMTYAVSMATIRQFEQALGRVALWAPNLRRDPVTREVISGRPEDEFVRRLRIYPHGLRQANAYYHPGKKALLLGYFPANGADVGRNLPGGMIFSALSYDIIAHETTHALLDGVHRYFTEPSNPDVLAFHEAFADVVAMFQHFTHPEVLRHQIATSRGDMLGENMLGVLARQFGEATGNRGALRQYLGRSNEAGGKWEAIPPDSSAIRTASEPHQRGAILVAALFRAFANIYENRVKDLRRIATRGTGILPAGDLHPDLVNRMAQEASKAAGHLLSMCIRALDYIPPVDVTFGEYLRALITADHDLVRDDDLGYRVSVVSAFRDWGIYPGDVRSLSVESLLWCPPEVATFQHAIDFFRDDPDSEPDDDGRPGRGGDRGPKFAPRDWNLRSDRLKTYVQMRELGGQFHKWLSKNFSNRRDRFLGLTLGDDAPGGIRRRKEDGKPTFEVHSLRPCRRIGPDGQERSDVVVEIVQRRKAFFDRDAQAALDANKGAGNPAAWAAAQADFTFRGGCTLVIDPESGDVRVCVRKSITQEGRLEQERRFRQGQFGVVGGAYLSGDDGVGNPFRFLHGGC